MKSGDAHGDAALTVAGTTGWQGSDYHTASAVDVTGLFSLRENAIAKEPGLSYSESWRCVS